VIATCFVALCSHIHINGRLLSTDVESMYCCVCLRICLAHPPHLVVGKSGARRSFKPRFTPLAIPTGVFEIQRTSHESSYLR
jgi:hypothetical protein